MRPIYLILKVLSLRYAYALFYKRLKAINNIHPRFGSTIYISNHPNSFMDPMMIGFVNRPVVHFMTRSDVFKWWLQPVLWASHMLPIFRQHDGEDTKTANQGSFDKVSRALARGQNILIFGEGFTDDTPILGLKPVKKGGVRMGFMALQSINWSKKIYLCALGVNYSDRNKRGSEVVLVSGNRICLNDYKEAFEANPNKTITELTKRIEKEMQECIIYVANSKWYSFVDTIMQLTRKGYNNENHDDTIPVEERLAYSQRLATWVNKQDLEREDLQELKKDLDGYFALLKRMKMQDRFVRAKQQPELMNRTKEFLILLFAWPVALIGFVHGFIPYLLAKKMTEKMFRRKVFWGSVKMMLGKLFGTIYNIPVIWVITHFFFPYWWMGFIYFWIVPALCQVTWIYVKAFQEFRIKGAMKTLDVSKFEGRRAELLQRIEKLVEVA